MRRDDYGERAREIGERGQRGKREKGRERKREIYRSEKEREIYIERYRV